MRIQNKVIDDWLQAIAPEGELDAYTGPELNDAVAEALDEGHSWLVIDLRKVDYIDSVGLGILIGGAKQTNKKNGDLAVVCDKDNVRRVFSISGTEKFLNVVDDFVEAVEILSSERAARTAGQPEDYRGNDSEHTT